MQIDQQNKCYKFSLILLFAVFAFHLGRHVNDCYVPESDFFDFRDKAVTLRNLVWPDNFKRPPLYAASIALVSTFIPGQNRELYAAVMKRCLEAQEGLEVVEGEAAEILRDCADIAAGSAETAVG